MKFTKKYLLIAGIIALAAILALTFFKKEKPSNYIFYEIQKGDVVHEINANGTINPVRVINVGTQITAIIKKIYVNYNDRVQKDQVLAELDTSLLIRQVEIDKGNADKIKATLDYNRLNWQRNQQLFASGYIAKSELDQAFRDYKSSQAEFDSVSAQYKKSLRNLNLATIKSPVAGVVVSKEVSEGQTVTSGLQTPDLFKIAQDLTKMQIETSVSEADISFIKNNQEVSFSVDAYQNLKFSGTVNQIRLDPTTTDNVVTYTVIINIDNKDLKLLPGMTAFVNILIDKRENVLKVPNGALTLNLKEIPTNLNADKDSAIIYKIIGKEVSPILVKKGLANEFETEIASSEIKEGDKIIQDVFVKGAVKAKKDNGPPGF